MIFDNMKIRFFSEKIFPIFNHSIFYPGRKRKYELDLPFLQKMVCQKKEIYQPSDEEAPLRNQVSTGPDIHGLIGAGHRALL